MTLLLILMDGMLDLIWFDGSAPSDTDWLPSFCDTTFPGFFLFDNSFSVSFTGTSLCLFLQCWCFSRILRLFFLSLPVISCVTSLPVVSTLVYVRHSPDLYASLRSPIWALSFLYTFSPWLTGNSNSPFPNLNDPILRQIYFPPPFSASVNNTTSHLAQGRHLAVISHFLSLSHFQNPSVTKSYWFSLLNSSWIFQLLFISMTHILVRAWNLNE